MVLIDEAYHHFAGGTGAYVSFLDRPLADPRVMVTRTISKIYGLAGMRVGYAVASVEIASRLAARRLTFGVGVVSAQAACKESISTRREGKFKTNARSRTRLEPSTF